MGAAFIAATLPTVRNSRLNIILRLLFLSGANVRQWRTRDWMNYAAFPKDEAVELLL
ncbi:hypothetical protein ACFKHW_21190 [Bradyrhizobium lupini]|uniref:hypothetical protein n=1 Tax=Rhizobium lupini TaxID=136996 RepID=UPI00366BA110